MWKSFLSLVQSVGSAGGEPGAPPGCKHLGHGVLPSWLCEKYGFAHIPPPRVLCALPRVPYSLSPVSRIHTPPCPVHTDCPGVELGLCPQRWGHRLSVSHRPALPQCQPLLLSFTLRKL